MDIGSNLKEFEKPGTWAVSSNYMDPRGCVFSQKLAVASWSYSCFSKGRGRSESNTGIFDLKPTLPPKLPGHFEAVSEADGHGLKSCQGRPSVTLKLRICNSLALGALEFSWAQVNTV